MKQLENNSRFVCFYFVLKAFLCVFAHIRARRQGKLKRIKFLVSKKRKIRSDVYTLSLRWHLFHFMSPRFFAEGVFFSAPVLPFSLPHPHFAMKFSVVLRSLAVRQRGLAAARRVGSGNPQFPPTRSIENGGGKIIRAIAL